MLRLTRFHSLAPLGAAFFVSVLALGACAPAAPKSLEHLQVTLAADTALYAPVFVAMDKGFYADEGLEVEIVTAAGGAATAALISGEVPYSTSAGAALSAMVRGAPLKVVYTNADHAGLELWASAPDIQTLGDLPGHAVSVQSRGDALEVALRIALAQAGVDPETVGYTPVGTGSQRLAPFLTGQVPAAVLSTPDVVQYKAQGGRGALLSDLKNTVRMVYNGVVVTNDELQTHPDRVTRFLRATIKGREYVRRLREPTLDILGKHNNQQRAANEADYDDAVPVMTADATVLEDVQRADLTARARVIGVAPEAVPPINQLFDYSIAKQVYADLARTGWQPTP
jgi:NitT/TauT family transport system substrate-binding protein